MTTEQPQKTKQSKSRRVQEYLQANPQARNKECVEALQEFGVTAADVSNAKTQLKKRLGRKRTRAAAVVAATVGGSLPSVDENASINLAEIEATLEFVQSVGDVKRAQQLLSLVQQIRDL